jgi:hypothetical protein
MFTMLNSSVDKLSMTFVPRDSDVGGNKGEKLH